MHTQTHGCLAESCVLRVACSRRVQSGLVPTWSRIVKSNLIYSELGRNERFQYTTWPYEHHYEERKMTRGCPRGAHVWSYK